MEAVKPILGFVLGVGIIVGGVTGWHYWHIDGLLAIVTVLIGIGIAATSVGLQGG